MPKPKVDYSKPQEEWTLPVVFPVKRRGVVDVKKGARGAGRIISHVSVGAIKKDELVVCVYDLPAGLEWLGVDEFFHAVCGVSASGRELIFKRVAKELDEQRLRVPSFVQGEEYPLCCGRSMVFVAQFDDDSLCAEPPPGAKVWWHDLASFYVFTCPNCLQCKAIGQQF